MSFWSTDRWGQRLEEVIPQGDPNLIEQGAYELSLGSEAYVSGDKKGPRLAGDLVRIEPGQIAVLLTHERVQIPDDSSPIAPWGNVGF